MHWLALFALAVKITVHDSGAPVNTFVPATTFGAGIDGRESGDAARTFTAHNIHEMQSAHFGPLTYRLRTELAIEAWHWNPSGRWSDADHAQGYWTSEVTSGPLPDSYGYRLPRRGSTTDQANNDGYSRLDDGDTSTFWKSNPYLDEAFTHEDNANHPQWIAIDFGKRTPINALRISWGEPYATQYAVEYCAGRAGDLSDQLPRCWLPFPASAFANAHTPPRIDILAQKPVKARFIRIILTDSCRCLSQPTTDIRDRLGYAVREIEAGIIEAHGNFHDNVRHSSKPHQQTPMVVSSTDPWHTAGDLDRRIEQPSFDRIVASGLTNGQPMLVPISVLYDTPENAANEIRYLLARGYPIAGVEAGEEPDGQYATPEDYGALYIQAADTIHAAAPSLKLGGPSFQTIVNDYSAMPLHGDRRTWFRRFLDYLRKRGRMNEYAFFSFEWYPFDDICAPAAPQVAEHAALFRDVLERLERDGLSRDIPWFMSEYGYSAFAGRDEVDIEGALLNSEAVGLFLTLGGSRAFLYGFEPNALMDELACHSWGNNAMFLADDSGQAFATTAIYWAARLLNDEWVVPGSEVHGVFVAQTDQPLVSAFAVRRPDHKLGLLIVNKDPKRAYRTSFHSDADVFTYSRKQYVWKPNGAKGRAVVNAPPRHERKKAADAIVLPPYSISVVRISR